jgi:hypothetical protein
MSIRWSGWIWSGGAWKKVCERGDRSRCAKELAKHARAAGIKDPTRLALSVGNVPPWTPPTSGEEAASSPGDSNPRPVMPRAEEGSRGRQPREPSPPRVEK